MIDSPVGHRSTGEFFALLHCSADGFDEGFTVDVEDDEGVLFVKLLVAVKVANGLADRQIRLRFDIHACHLAAENILLCEIEDRTNIVDAEAGVTCFQILLQNVLACLIVEFATFGFAEIF